MVTESTPTSLTPLRVNDIKQYAYCPRVTFYHRVMEAGFAPTYKMTQGKLEQDRIERLENRRKLRKYGLEKAQRRFHVWLGSESLGLGGVLDMLLLTDSGPIPVDFKMTTRRPGRNHFLQLAAYALLVEEWSGREVETAFIYQIPAETAIVAPMTASLKSETRALIDKIRRMVEKQRFPPPTPHRGRCVECEFRNYCGDVL